MTGERAAAPPARRGGRRSRPHEPAGIDRVPRRQLVTHDLDVHVRLHPGDRVLVELGQEVERGTTIVERLRDGVVTRVTAGAEAKIGDRFRTGVGEIEAELLHPISGLRWRAVAGTVIEPIESPVDGVVAEVRPGAVLTLSAKGLALPGVAALGSPVRGRLEVIAENEIGDVSHGLDVGRAGTILPLGLRVDAEVLTRARAMGVRGVIAAGLGGKERRDTIASERRQRAGSHGPPPFGVLILDGTLRRPIASVVRTLLVTLVGREAAIVTDPPALICQAPPATLPALSSDAVRVRHGPLAGAEGQFLGLAGDRRFAAGVVAAAAHVQLGDGPPVAIPLANLERFV